MFMLYFCGFTRLPFFIILLSLEPLVKWFCEKVVVPREQGIRRGEPGQKGSEALLPLMPDHNFTASQVAGSNAQPVCKKKRCFSVRSLRSSFQGIHQASPESIMPRVGEEKGFLVAGGQPGRPNHRLEACATVASTLPALSALTLCLHLCSASPAQFQTQAHQGGFQVGEVIAG